MQNVLFLFILLLLIRKRWEALPTIRWNFKLLSLYKKFLIFLCLCDTITGEGKGWLITLKCYNMVMLRSSEKRKAWMLLCLLYEMMMVAIWCPEMISCSPSRARNRYIIHYSFRCYCSSHQKWIQSGTGIAISWDSMHPSLYASGVHTECFNMVICYGLVLLYQVMFRNKVISMKFFASEICEFERHIVFVSYLYPVS